MRARLCENQRLIDQTSELVKGAGSAHRLRRGQIETAGEHGQPPEELLLGAAQQLVAPVDGCSKGLVPNCAATATAPQQREAVLEMGQHLGWAEHTDPSGGELDRQGQPVETAAKLPDSRRILDPHGRMFGSGALNEQARGVLFLQGPQAPDDLTIDTPWLPAGGQHSHTRALLAYCREEVAAGVDQVLAVVEY